MLKVLLLGSPEILLDQRSVDGLRRKNRAVIYYLAAQRDPQSRDHILTLFWPDHERASAQQILRTMLHDLRKHLGSALLVDGDMLALEGAEVDGRAFQAHLMNSLTDIAQLSEDMQLYRGDFLHDFVLPDSPEFDDWVAAQRQYYQSLAIRGWSALSHLYESSRNYSSALETLEQALRFDPLQEDLQRACMRLEYLKGDRPSAIFRYDRFYKLLDAELGVTPMAETRALYDAILADAGVSANSDRETITVQTNDVSFLPFVGRTTELQTLGTKFSAGKLFMIEGEPGIGKTRLAEVFLRQYVQDNRALVLRGNAYELEQGLPYQPVIDALRGLLNLPEWKFLKAEFNLVPLWLSEITRLMPEFAAEFPSLSPPITTASEGRLWESLRQFLLHLARQRPIILFVDDLQWADASTLGFLGYLIRRTGSLPMLTLATVRPISGYPALTAFFSGALA